MSESLQDRPESVSEETEEALQEAVDGEGNGKPVIHLEKALNSAEKEEVKFEIRQALQQILT